MEESVKIVYQQQINFVNTIKRMYSPEIMHTQQAMKAFCEQMKPMQASIKQFSNIQPILSQSMYLFVDNIDTTDIQNMRSNMVSMVKQFQKLSEIHVNLDIENMKSMSKSFYVLAEILKKSYPAVSTIQTDKFVTNITQTAVRIPGTAERKLGSEEIVSNPTKKAIAICGSKKKLLTVYLYCSLAIFAVVIMISLPIEIAVPILIDYIFPMIQLVKACLIPVAQSAIVYLQNKQDTYFVKADSAKIYELPNSHSAVIANALYGDEVCKLEDVKLWVKIEWRSDNGNTITGWIAKRNLMPYKDYEFNSDKLCEK